MARVEDVGSAEAFRAAVTGAPKGAAAHFWAGWCEPCKRMDELFGVLAESLPAARFLRVEAEAFPEISESYGVTAVPYFLFFRGGELVASLEGADPERLDALAQEHLGAPSEAAPMEEEQSEGGGVSLEDRLGQLVRSSSVMLFMKGSPEEPRCGFSRKVVAALEETGVPFGHFDILSDEEVRQGLKKFSDWPTYPQLYVNGEFLGGCDIVLEMAQEGELREALSAKQGTEGGGSLEDRLGQLVRSSSVMLFMKGSPEEPRCGFSRKVVAALEETGVPFGHFDILSDEEVRQGLKKFSDWPTYPQLYVNGEFLGGCDIVLEMAQEGELRESLGAK